MFPLFQVPRCHIARTTRDIIGPYFLNIGLTCLFWGNTFIPCRLLLIPVRILGRGKANAYFVWRVCVCTSQKEEDLINLWDNNNQ